VVETSEEDYQKIMDVNVKSIFLVSKHAIPEMIKSGGGSLINRGSKNSHIGFPGIAAYNASKGAVLQLTKNMTLDYLPNNIRVNAVSPGPIMTAAAASAFEKNSDLETLTIARIPMGRLGKPEEVAYADLFLASGESSYYDRNLIVSGWRLYRSINETPVHDKSMLMWRWQFFSSTLLLFMERRMT
jgi:dihydroanticapsin dehydrogenase